MNALTLLYVGFGGAIGSMCRYLVGVFFTRAFGTAFPYATLFINVAGGFLMGAWIATAAFAASDRTKDLHLLIAVGVLGGFTTFSTFTLDAFMLVENGMLLQATLYIVGSVLLSFLALMAGMWLVNYFAV